jgi:phospholipid/cholesterol/gamma-HCH transport system substrate-binding protein
MSTILNIRNLKLPAVSRTALVVGTVVVLAIVGGLIGWNVYKKLTTNTVMAYFPDTLALPFYPLGARLFRRVRRS